NLGRDSSFGRCGGGACICAKPLLDFASAGASTAAPARAATLGSAAGAGSDGCRPVEHGFTERSRAECAREPGTIQVGPLETASIRRDRVVARFERDGKKSRRSVDERDRHDAQDARPNRRRPGRREEGYTSKKTGRSPERVSGSSDSLQRRG